MTGDDYLTHAALLGFFARLLHPGLDPAWLAECRQAGLFEDWPFPPPDREAAAALAILRVLELGEVETARVVEDNAVLFVGPEAPVPMWESVWREKDGLLFGDTTLEVQRHFRQAGFVNPAEGREPDDHLALELSFLAALLARAGTAADQGDQDAAEHYRRLAADFMTAHPARWAADCLREIRQRAATPFYEAIATLAMATLRETARQLAE